MADIVTLHSDVKNAISNDCSMFGVENIYTDQKDELVKEECSREYSHGLREVVKFQIISLVASQTYALDPHVQFTIS